MFHPILALDIQELINRFGIHTDAFIAHSIAFAILAAVVIFFGIKPVMKQLEERRQRIEEGEAMHARSQKELADVKESGEKILSEARASGKEELAHARQSAAKLQSELSEKAAADARALLANAKRQAEMDCQREKDALKGEFARLLAEATSHVTGKVLSEEDHRAINEEAIRQL